MGMFDFVRCEVPLPDGYTGELQTKDFDCEMTTHVISKEGRLLLDRGYNEWVPEEERPYPNEHGLLGLRGALRRVKKYEDANFHGVVNFYYIDHEYYAKFTEGQLVGITTDHPSALTRKR